MLAFSLVLTLKPSSSPRQDVQRSHRPREKPHLDSNNNENSVPKDFDSVDSNSNLGARSKHAKHKLDRAKAPKSTNEVLKFPAARARSPSRNHTFIRQPRPQAPTVSAAPQGSSREPPFHRAEPPTGWEPRKEAQCEISGKEAISALSRAKSRQCRQQIVQVYCRHQEGALMPRKVPRLCPTEGEPGR